MTNAKLFEKLGALLESSEDADKKHIKKLRKILQKLKKKQKHLEASLKDTEGDHERRRLYNDIEVLELQRKKGAKVYKALKRAQSETEAPKG